MILYLDRSCLGLGFKIYSEISTSKQFIHKFAHLLYSNVNWSCFGHPSCDLSQDRQLSGQRSSSSSILASDPTPGHKKIYSLSGSLMTQWRKITFQEYKVCNCINDLLASIIKPSLIVS